MTNARLCAAVLVLCAALSACSRDPREEALRYLGQLEYTQIELRPSGPGSHFVATHNGERCAGYVSVPPGAFGASQITTVRCSALPSAAAPP